MNIFGATQGWECPNCHHVYSPYTPECLHCPMQIQSIASTWSNGDPIRFMGPVLNPQPNDPHSKYPMTNPPIDDVYLNK